MRPGLSAVVHWLRNQPLVDPLGGDVLTWRLDSELPAGLDPGEKRGASTRPPLFFSRMPAPLSAALTPPSATSGSLSGRFRRPDCAIQPVRSVPSNPSPQNWHSSDVAVIVSAPTTRSQSRLDAIEQLALERRSISAAMWCPWTAGCTVIDSPSIAQCVAFALHLARYTYLHSDSQS